jgi:hypothetical protein
MILRRHPRRRRKPPAWAPVFRFGRGRAVITVVVVIFVLQHLYLVAQLFQQQAAQEEEQYYTSRDRRFIRRQGGDQQHQQQQQQAAPLLVPNKNGAALYHEMKQAALKFNRPAIAKVLIEHAEFDIAMPSQSSNNMNRTLTLADFPELVYDNDEEEDYYDTTTDKQQHDSMQNNNNSNDNNSIHGGRQEILDILQKAGIAVDEHVLHRLPTWQNDVVPLYGDSPIVVGMETCAAFRNAVAAEDRFVGVGGQQNAGTTVLSHLLMNNLRIPQNYQVSFGMTFQLPWNKHGWRSMRGKLQEYSPYYEKIVLPVIVIRDPFVWMHSMCESPYDMLWDNHNISTSSSSGGSTGVAPHCPNLVQPHKSGNTAVSPQEADGEPVRVSWARAFHREWQSLAHVWSEWYKEYLEQADFPRLIVRHEGMYCNRRLISSFAGPLRLQKTLHLT